MLGSIRTWLEQSLGLNPAMQDRLLASVLVVVGLWMARRLALAVVWRRVEDVRSRYRWRKSLTYTAVVVALLVVGRIWWEGLDQVATFLGLLSAGLAIALKDVVASLAGWAFILWRRPFEVGDRVQVGDHAGDVIDVRIFQFSLLEIGNWVDADQSTGRVIHVPNAKVLTDVVANYSKGFQQIWDELPVLVTFESNWRKAKRTEPGRRRSVAEAMWEDVLDEFAGCDDIDFAYPTRRLYDNVREGKPGTRPAVEA